VDYALTLTDKSSPIDFADLLIGQLAGRQPDVSLLTEATTASAKPTNDDLPEIISFLNTPDPAQNPLLALIQTPLAPSPRAVNPPAKNEAIPSSGASLMQPAEIPLGKPIEMAISPSLTPISTPISHSIDNAFDKSVDQAVDKAASKLPTLAKEIRPSTVAADAKASSITTVNFSTNVAQPMAPPALVSRDTAEAAILAGEGKGNSNTAASVFSPAISPNPHAPATLPAPVRPTELATQLRDSRWSQDFGERIVWMAKNDQQQAQINISPAHLGPIQITLNMSGDQANIVFASPHAEVRKAIEEAMPNLRDLLSSSGISLGQSDVGSEFKQPQQEMNSHFANGQRATGETAILAADDHPGLSTSEYPVRQRRGLVDLFA
jgi:flagellar hook-length control protein FliK